MEESTLQRIQQHSTVEWHRRLYEYGVAIGVALLQYTIFSTYLFGRRGFYDLFIINKVFAGIAATMLGLTLLIGPTSRMFNAFDKYLRFRKEFGIVAFFASLFHVITSLFLLPDRFPIARYLTKGFWPFVFGMAGILVLFLIYSISNGAAVRWLTPKTWWHIQQWGIRLAFALVALHVGIMKVPGWIGWYKKGGASDLTHPEWPGLGLLVGWFLAAVLLIRIAEPLNKKFGVAMWYVCAILLPLIYIGTFVWGRRFL